MIDGSIVSELSKLLQEKALFAQKGATCGRYRIRSEGVGSLGKRAGSHLVRLHLNGAQAGHSYINLVFLEQAVGNSNPQHKATISHTIE